MSSLIEKWEKTAQQPTSGKISEQEAPPLNATEEPAAAEEKDTAKSDARDPRDAASHENQQRDVDEKPSTEEQKDAA